MENIISKYTLTDEVISHLVKLLQLGLLEGTDITDHFRRIEMVIDEEGKLYLSDDYQEAFEDSLSRMESFIKEQQSNAEGE